MSLLDPSTHCRRSSLRVSQLSCLLPLLHMPRMVFLTNSYLLWYCLTIPPWLPLSQLPCQQGKPKLSILRKRSKCFFWHQLMPVNAAVCARIWYTCCPFIIHTFTHMYVRVCGWVYMVLSPMWNRARRYNIHSIIAVHFTKTETFLTDRSITDIFCGVHWDVADHYPHSCPHSCSHCLV